MPSPKPNKNKKKGESLSISKGREWVNTLAQVLIAMATICLVFIAYFSSYRALTELELLKKTYVQQLILQNTVVKLSAMNIRKATVGVIYFDKDNFGKAQQFELVDKNFKKGSIKDFEFKLNFIGNEFISANFPELIIEAKLVADQISNTKVVFFIAGKPESTYRQSTKIRSLIPRSEENNENIIQEQKFRLFIYIRN